MPRTNKTTKPRALALGFIVYPSFACKDYKQKKKHLPFLKDANQLGYPDSNQE